MCYCTRLTPALDVKTIIISDALMSDKDLHFDMLACFVVILLCWSNLIACTYMISWAILKADKISSWTVIRFMISKRTDKKFESILIKFDSVTKTTLFQSHSNHLFLYLTVSWFISLPTTNQASPSHHLCAASRKFRQKCSQRPCCSQYHRKFPPHRWVPLSCYSTSPTR